MKYLKTYESYFDIEWKIQEIMDWFRRNRISKVDFTKYNFEPVKNIQETEDRIITIYLESIYRQGNELGINVRKNLLYPKSGAVFTGKQIFRLVPTIFDKEGYKTILKQLESLTPEQIEDIRAEEEADKFNF